MQPHMQAKKVRKHTRFGSLSAQATPVQSPVPELVNLTMKVNGSNTPYVIYSGGQWTQRPLNLKRGMNVTFEYETKGNALCNGFLYATFSNKQFLGTDAGPTGSVRQFLFVRPISPSNGRSLSGKVSVPIMTNAPNLIFYLTPKLPNDVQAEYLNTLKEKQLLTVGGMREPLSDNAFRSPSLGFFDATKYAKAMQEMYGKFPYAVPTEGERSEHYELWDFKRSSHSWKKVGYSGAQEKLDSGKTLNAPQWTAGGDPYVAVRMSIYQWRDGPQEQFGGDNIKGWDAVRLNAEIPAGVPMCLVWKSITHDRDSGMSRPEWYNSSGDWYKENVFFAPYLEQLERTGKTGEKKKVWDGYGSDTVISYMIPPGHSRGSGKVMDTSDMAKADGSPLEPYRITHASSDEKGYHISDARNHALKVEWWNGTGWTEPRVHPPKDVKRESDALYRAVFRLPRQLSSDHPDVKTHPHWDIKNTYDCYPRFSVRGRGADRQTRRKFVVLGRQKVVGDDGVARFAEIDHAGEKLTAVESVPFQVHFINHGQIMTGYHTTFAAADPANYAYVNSTQFNNVYWKEGEFSPGATLVVIGQGLNKAWDIAMTTKKDDKPSDIYTLTKNMDRTTEGGAGTARGDLLRIEAVITADTLFDNVATARETKVRDAWKEVFGVELSASWFDIVGTGGTLPDGSTLTPLKNQSPNNATKYRTLHDGVEYEFPYSIAIVKVPSNWVGPVLDFEKDVAGEPQLTEKSIKKGTMLYITSQTAFQQIIEQPIVLDEEIQYQLDKLAEGLTPDAVLVGNDMDHDAVVNTAAVVDQDRIDNLDDGDDGTSGGFGIFSALFNLFKGKRKTLVADNAIRRKTLIPIGKTQRISGFGSSPIMEDVTKQYSADHVSGLGAIRAGNRPTPDTINYNNFSEIEEVYAMNGKATSPNLGWFAGATPDRRDVIRANPVERKQFGSIGSASMHSRATRRGNPMEVTLVHGVSRPFRKGDRRHRMG
tara:strand:- start:1828 stop:4788 length:2961 start_codon:yes stop_codon:yes gene_type:complete